MTLFDPLAIPAGAAVAPSLRFSSETSLGIYRSAASTLAVSYGTVSVPALVATGSPIRANNSVQIQLLDASGNPAYFVCQGDNNLILYGTNNTGAARAIWASLMEDFTGNFSMSVQLRLIDGSTSVPSVNFVNEQTLGWYRVAAGGMGLASGQLELPAGTALAPTLTYSSESSLGLYRSAASTLALSYGTIDLTGSGAMTSIASLKIKSGTNNSCGTAVLGSNGSVNVANTYVKTGDLIFLTDQTPGGTLGDLEMTGIRNSSGFTIASTSVTDTSTVAWLIIRPG